MTSMMWLGESQARKRPRTWIFGHVVRTVYKMEGMAGSEDGGRMTEDGIKNKSGRGKKARHDL
jgi:hypothetical protein